MKDSAASHQTMTHRGQILVLAALLMVLLIGFTGLAIDVSAAYMADRWQRAVADAAALAGGQDLQKPGTRELPGPSEYQAARQHAMEILVRQLGATSTPSVGAGSPCLDPGGCPLPGTPYVVAIRTPSPSAVDCEPARCIQVSVRQPAFGLTFARIFGQDSWNVNVTSVAGRIYEKQYGIVTLRPPKDSRGAANPYENDIFITGGSKVLVSAADVATNTNVVCSGFSSGSEMRLDSGYFVYHYDPYEAWLTSPGRCFAPPLGSQLTTPVSDPGYPIPTRTGSETTFLNYLDGEDTSAACAAEQAKVPDEYLELATGQKINDPTKVRARCFLPGVYKQTLEAKNESGLPVAVLLMPGVYYFDAGVRVQTSLLGGYEPGRSGVAVVLKEAKNSSGEPGQFTTTQSTSLVAINSGSLYCPGLAGTLCPPVVPPDPRCPGSANGRCWATPADGPQGPVQTPGTKPVLMSVMVVPTGTCPVGPIAPPTCNQNEHKTLSLSGGGNIFLAGVQYAPEDNATLTGNSGQKAEIGAFWAWTISFNGGSQFTLASALPDVTGVLRLDPACSPTVNVCNP